MYLFSNVIDGWTSWGHIFQSKEAFTRLIFKMLSQAGLQTDVNIENLTPGTNAVFKVGEHVIKIYAPKESGLDTENDFNTEILIMNHVSTLSISSPKVIYAGEIMDKYLFRYIIMNWIDGTEARKIVLTYDKEKKAEFVKSLKNTLKKLHSPFDRLDQNDDLRQRAILNERIIGLSPSLIEDLIQCANSQSLSPYVLVHGDITGENVLVLPDNEIAFIDFADSIMAPVHYELPPIIFELFRADKFFVRAFIGEDDVEKFIEELVKGLAIHDFCGNILKDFFERLCIPPDRVESIEELKQILRFEWV